MTAAPSASQQPVAAASAKNSPSTPSPSPPAPSDVPFEHLRVSVLERRPHDRTSYTEGFELDDGRLFEDSAYGSANLREEDPTTGSVVRSAAIQQGFFAEGITVVDDKIVQLTWQNGKAFVYRLSDLSQIGTFSYDTEGWGLCDDGSRLVMSDGTSELYFRDRTTFALLGSVQVTQQGSPLEQLNELECVDGDVYANVWMTNSIVRIDPSDGVVTAEIDASGLLSPADAPGDEGAVLNGIAYDSQSATFLLTGKLWPAMFEVRFVPS